MSKVLVVYFSHNKENYFNGKIEYIEKGNTSVVAGKIKDITGGDIFEIRPLHEYPAKYNDCTKLAKKEQQSQARPKIINIVPSFSQYDTIYLGYPNWWGTMPMIVKTFIESYDFTGKDVYPFCTHEGGGLGHSESDLKKMLPESIIHDGLAIRGSYVYDCDKELKEWVGE